MRKFLSIALFLSLFFNLNAETNKPKFLGNAVINGEPTWELKDCIAELLSWEAFAAASTFVLILAIDKKVKFKDSIGLLDEDEKLISENLYEKMSYKKYFSIKQQLLGSFPSKVADRMVTEIWTNFIKEVFHGEGIVHKKILLSLQGGVLSTNFSFIFHCDANNSLPKLNKILLPLIQHEFSFHRFDFVNHISLIYKKIDKILKKIFAEEGVLNLQIPSLEIPDWGKVFYLGN